MQTNMNKVSIPDLPLKVWVSRWNEEVAPFRNNSGREGRFIRFWESHFGDQIAHTITPLQIETVADELYSQVSQKTGDMLSYETRRKYLLMLSFIYTTALKDWKWCLYNPLTGVNMKPKEEPKKHKDMDHSDCKGFLEFKGKVCSIVNKKRNAMGLTCRQAASLCGMQMSSFQHAIDEKSNITLKQLIILCNGYGITLSLEDNDGN